jgi:WD40 repeat protein
MDRWLFWLTAMIFCVAASRAVAQVPEKPIATTSGATHDCCALSADGKRLALDWWSLFDTATGEQLHEGSMHGAHGMGFSPDGSLFAVGGNYAEFKVFNTADGKVYWDLSGMGQSVINDLEFSKDGKWLVSCADSGMLRVWDVRAKKPQALFCLKSTVKLHNEYEEYLSAWRALAGNTPPDGVKVFAILDTDPIECINRLSVSPDSKSVALAVETAEVWILELSTGKVSAKLSTNHVATMSVVYSNDGKLLAIGGGRGDNKQSTIEIWDVATQKRLTTFKGHRQTVLRVAISPDNKTLLSGGLFDGVRVWDIETGKERYALHQERQARIVGLEFLPDGKSFITLVDDKDSPVYFWETATGKQLAPKK